MEDAGRRLCHAVGEIAYGRSEFHVGQGLGVGLGLGRVGPA